MSLFKQGRLCLKLAGRDAGRKCVVVEEVDNTYVLIDGDVRRKKVNVKHLEPLEETLDVGKGSSDEVMKAFEKLGLNVWVRKSKKSTQRPKKQKVKKDKPESKKKPLKDKGSEKSSNSEKDSTMDKLKAADGKGARGNEAKEKS